MRKGAMLLALSLLPFAGCLPGLRPAEGRALRVVGRVTGFHGDPSEIEVHCGSGPHRTVSDYQRAEHAWNSYPFPEENRIWDLDLPAVASRWEVRKPDPEGFFDCGWVEPEGAPQLVVIDRSGRLATRELPLPLSSTARATVQAGEISPQETVTLEIDGSSLPKTSLPLALAAGIEKAEVPPGTETAVALHLALLNRVFPRLARFLMRRGEIPLDLTASPVRIPGLPRFSRLDLYVTGPLPGILLRRSVTSGADSLLKLSLSGPELLGFRRRIPLSGVVRWQDGSPVPGATLVYSSYPDRIEIQTDGEGRFEIPSAAAGREAVLFVDAAVPGARPPFDRVTVTHRLDIARDATAAETSINLPPAPDAAAGCF